MTVQVKPVYSPPQLFPIGEETITYIATDRSGNQANCSFTVTVIGEFILQRSAVQRITGSLCGLREGGKDFTFGLFPNKIHKTNQ